MKKLIFTNLNLKEAYREIMYAINEVANVERMTNIRYIKNFKEETDYAFMINGVWYRVFSCSWTPKFIYKLELREIPESAYRKEFCNDI